MKQQRPGIKKARKAPTRKRKPRNPPQITIPWGRGANEYRPGLFTKQYFEKHGEACAADIYYALSEEIIGPLLLDIDRTIEQGGGYLPNFDKALKDTRLLVAEYCSNLKDKDYRIFFTGHKGFHIEIQPKAVGISPCLDRWQHFENIRKDINKRFGNSFVDKFHPHIRLRNSVCSWIDYSGEKVDSVNFEISIDELFSSSAEDIFAKAKNLAGAALDW